MHHAGCFKIKAIQQTNFKISLQSKPQKLQLGDMLQEHMSDLNWINYYNN